MIRKSYHTIEYLLHGRNGFQIQILIGRGISGTALQEDNILISFLSAGLKSQLNVCQISNTGRHDDGLSGTGDLTDKGNIIDFKAGYLKHRHIHLLQKIYTGKIKGRGKEYQPHFLCDFLKLRLPLPGSISCLIKLVQCGSVPDSSLGDLEARIVTV